MNNIKEMIDFYYNAGFDLHPVLPNSKVPSRKNWNNLEKLKKDEILGLYKDNIPPEHSYNLGFRPGRRSRGVDHYIVVLDIDVKPIEKHQNGLDRAKLFTKDAGERERYKERTVFIQKWLEKYNLKANVITCSGGFHIYLFVRTDIYETFNLKANQTVFKNDELGIEFEILADGKNVVLPPSTVKLNNFLRKYEMINEQFNYIDAPCPLLNLLKPVETAGEQDIKTVEPKQEINAVDDIDILITKLAPHKAKLNGYDFELNLLGYCIDNQITSKIHDLFKIYYGRGYDEKRTSILIKQAQNKQNIRHAGSFIKMLNDAGLGELLKYIKTPAKQREFKKMGAGLANIQNIPKTKFNMLFPAGKLSLIAGAGAVGKTYIALYISLLFVKTNPGKTAFLLLIEDDEYTILKRTERLIDEYPFLDSAYKDNIHYICDGDEEIIKTDRFTKQLFYNEKNGLREIIKTHDINILDPLANLLPCDENDNAAVADFCKIMRGFVAGSDSSIIFLHHINKVKIDKISQNSILDEKADFSEIVDRIDKIRGASAFYNAVRYCLYVEKTDADNTAVATVIKNNYGRSGNIPLMLEIPIFKTNQVENINPEAV